MSGPFSKYALEYNDHNLSIVPCGGDEGKRALVKWAEYQREHPPLAVFDSWITDYADKNIGLITGHLNRITVVDCDDPNRSIESLESEYGATSLAVQTARGGKHLYYQYNGETSRNAFRPKIDIKADGGYVIGPYSLNPKNGKYYSFIKGSLEDIGSLATSTHPALPKPGHSGLEVLNNSPSKKLTITAGQRNDYLFKATKNFAISVDTFEEVLAYAQRQNTEILSPPLSDAEIMRIVNSVYKYKTEGRLWASGQHCISITADKFGILCLNPRALALYILLLKCHKNRKIFTIIQTEVAKLLFCDPRTVGESVNYLIQKEIIERIHRSRGKNDGHQYRFC